MAKESLRKEPHGGANAQLATGGLRGFGDLFFNRELSLLAFYQRVLEEALDGAQPLLERLKFLSIFSSYIDEFFMIRVSALKEGADENISEMSVDGRTPSEQLKEIRKRLLPLIADEMRCLREEVLPQLKAEGIEIVSYKQLNEIDRQRLEVYFREKVFKVLTPLAVDPAHPFPYISGLNLNLGLMVEPLPQHGITASLSGKFAPRFVRIKVPPIMPRLVPIGENETRYVLLEDLIAANTHFLFPRMRVGTCHAFRVTRDADVEIREDEAHDLLQMMEQTLRKRRFGTPVRLEVATSMPSEMVNYLTNALNLTPDEVYVIDGQLKISDLMALYKLDRPELKDTPFRQTIPAALRGNRSVFDVIKEQDVLLHHPYDSYSGVTDFIRAAAEDPDVLAIKMCLYRTGANSPIPEALIEASERGKQVTAVVELRARFDEENNIEWAKRLEEAGVHVVYGLVGLKIHSKLSLIVRRENDALRCYVHIATGNYNPTTSCVYTDLGLFTADEEIGEDAIELFNYLTGFTRQKEYRQLMVSPVNTRQRMLALIEREAAHARGGREARIIAKINRLTDTEIIRALYEASQAGAQIDLIVRSVCTLRPGVAGLSENIRVRSIVGRFLEHSRIFYFANGGAEEVYIGSADWMPRNLDRRVEVVAPVHDPQLKKFLKDEALATYLRDNVKARRLLPDGSYERIKAAPGEEIVNAQMYFIEKH